MMASCLRRLVKLRGLSKMKNRFVISPDGVISGLEYKQGVSLTKYGQNRRYKTKAKRVSEILFDENRQKWYIKLIHPSGDISVNEPPVYLHEYFTTYEDAVKYEIKYFEKLMEVR